MKRSDPHLLIKSHACNYDPENPYHNDMVLHPIFEHARKSGFVGEMVNLETDERLSTIQILDRCEEYVKGLLALGLTPGVDSLIVVGCPTMQAACLFVACSSIGIQYALPVVDREKSIILHADLVRPKVVVCGEGADGLVFTALTKMFDENNVRPYSTKLPYVEHLFYDDTYKDRSPSQGFIRTLDELRQVGKSITDEQVAEAKCSVKPDFVLVHFFSSGSTGVPKCISYTQGCYAGYMQMHPKGEINENALTLNWNTDPLISLHHLSMLLAGYISKLVIGPDTSSARPWSDTGSLLSNTIRDENIHTMSLTAAPLTALVRYMEKNSTIAPSVTSMTFSSQPYLIKFREECRKLFINSIHRHVYGMTETQVVAENSTSPTESLEEVQRLYVLPNTEVRLSDENDKAVDIGIDGEIQVKASARFKEYKSNPEMTRNLFTEDGFIKTGDVGVMYPDGSFIVRGRLADCLRFKVYGKVEYPAPLENMLTKHPGISEALVVAGKRNDWMGDEVTYCLRTAAGMTPPTEDELLKFCQQQGMSNNRQKPARIIYFESFPYTDNGRKVSKKLIREKLRDMIEENEDIGKCQWFKEVESSVFADNST